MKKLVLLYLALTLTLTAGIAIAEAKFEVGEVITFGTFEHDDDLSTRWTASPTTKTG
ncbi:MAG: hypothetical protein IKR85_10555 [Clostridia bacterium]|nr:hypothetical protein [Clostridia bacterium]